MAGLECINCLREDREIRPTDHPVVVELSHFPDGEVDFYEVWTGGLWHVECAEANLTLENFNG